MLLALAVGAHRYFVQTGTSPRPAPAVKSDPSGANIWNNCGGQPGCFSGTVTKVVDGDTLDVDGVRIRLVLVDAPERNTREGPAATEKLEQLCPVGSPATVLEDRLQPRDQYGRTLGLLWCGRQSPGTQQSVNEDMIRSGHARLYRRFCRASAFGREGWAVELGCR